MTGIAMHPVYLTFVTFVYFSIINLSFILDAHSPFTRRERNAAELIL
jgi:hypothetical protein